MTGLVSIALINKLSKKGVVIVAAADSSEKLTIPACYSNVLSVMYSPYVKDPKGYRYISNSISGVDVLVNVNEEIKMKDGTVTFFKEASSYAVPVICFEISKLLSQPERHYITKAKHGIIREKYIDWIDNPLIIVFSREEGEKIVDDFVMFNTYTVFNVTHSSIGIDLPELYEAYAKAQDIVIIDNFDNENGLIQFCKKC